MSTKITESLSAGVNLSANSIKNSKAGITDQSFYAVLDSAKSNADSQQTLKNVTDTDASEDSLAVDSGQQEVTNDHEKQVEQVPEAKEDVQEQERPQEEISTENVSQEEPSQEEEPAENLQNLLDLVAQQLGISKQELITDYKELQSQITEILTEKLGVTEEELMSALLKSGLTAVDVTEPSNLMKLFVSLNENLDASDILTNENLFAQLKDITAELKLVCADLSPEEMEQVQQIIKNLQDSDLNMKVSQPVSAEMENAHLKTQEVPVQDQEAPVQTETENLSTAKTDEEKDTSSKDSGQKRDNTGNDGFRGFVNQLVDTVKQTGSAQVDKVFVNQTEAENILRQLTDQIKIQVKADTASMEMQLYPESYGKLNLHVAVKEGIVTAQIVTESEAVKKALESQVIQLRENMNEQGLKVEAIEVTVQSHEFERNLQQDQSQQSFEQEAQKLRKNINLNEESDGSEENANISEEEALIRKIMIQNGSRINYSA